MSVFGGDLTFRDEILAGKPTAIVEEFEHRNSDIGQYLSTEHKDDGTHGDVTADSVTADRIQGSFHFSDLIRAIVAAPLIANVNDYNPRDFQTATWISLTSDASRSITGLRRPLPMTNRLILLHNAGTQNIILEHQHASSQVANQVYCHTGADITLNANDSVFIVYDVHALRWLTVGF